MASFKFLKFVSSKILIYMYIYIYVCMYVWHLKIFPLYLLTCIVAKVLIIYKFLVYMTKKNSINYKKCKYLD